MTPLPRIAYTRIGNNCLVAGLITHVAALLVGMMTAAPAEAFFKITYLVSCVLIAAGGFAELSHRQMPPLRGWRFYILASATVFPVLGPLLSLALIYSSFWEGGRACGPGLRGFFRSLWQLRANVLTVVALLVMLFLLFAFLSSKEDPYFQKQRRIKTGSSSRKMAPFIKKSFKKQGWICLR